MCTHVSRGQRTRPTFLLPRARVLYADAEYNEPTFFLSELRRKISDLPVVLACCSHYELPGTPLSDTPILIVV